MKTKKPIYSKKYFFPVFILIATLFMSVGYAAVNSVILSISGTAVAETQTGVYITDAHMDWGVGTGVEENSKITQVYQTNFGSSVFLAPSYSASYIYYVITVYNSTDDDYQYVGPQYVEGESTYDNPGISLTVLNISENYILKSKESITFRILFQYKNGVISESNVLNSIINFKFESLAEDEEEEEILTSAGTVINVGSSSSNIFGSTLSKYSVESISFVNHENIPEGATSWDASVEKNQSIKGWYVVNSNGMYDVYIGSKSGIISFPEDSSYMFSSFSSLKTINFNNVDTSQVTNMSYMFSSSYYLGNMDFSKFDTSNVTTMYRMFYYVYINLTEVDFSSLDTSNVTNTGEMFVYCYKISSIKLNNATFNNVTSYSNMFFGIVSDAVIVTKDETTKSWLTTKPLAYQQSVVVKTVAEYESQ